MRPETRSESPSGPYAEPSRDPARPSTRGRTRRARPGVTSAKSRTCIAAIAPSSASSSAMRSIERASVSRKAGLARSKTGTRSWRMSGPQPRGVGVGRVLAPGRAVLGEPLPNRSPVAVEQRAHDSAALVRDRSEAAGSGARDGPHEKRLDAVVPIVGDGDAADGGLCAARAAQRVELLLGEAVPDAAPGVLEVEPVVGGVARRRRIARHGKGRRARRTARRRTRRRHPRLDHAGGG